jgi:hypothetical protein
MFKGLVGVMRVAVELRRIANALEVIALHYARLDGRMWNPRKGSINVAGRQEDPELMHTDDAHMLVQQLRDEQEFMGAGYGPDEE